MAAATTAIARRSMTPRLKRIAVRPARIHAIDIVQPPGIGIPPIADMDAQQSIVIAALAAKSSAETPKKARSEASQGIAIRRRVSASCVAARLMEPIAVA
jgi:hypothetical protein